MMMSAICFKHHPWLRLLLYVINCNDIFFITNHRYVTLSVLLHVALSFIYNSVQVLMSTCFKFYFSPTNCKSLSFLHYPTYFLVMLQYAVATSHFLFCLGRCRIVHDIFGESLMNSRERCLRHCR